MNAKEFIKKFGWEKAISVRKDFFDDFYIFSLNDGYIDWIVGSQLSEYIDAYELVQSYGSLANAKNRCYPAKFIDINNYHALKQSITLIEEINA